MPKKKVESWLSAQQIEQLYTDLRQAGQYDHTVNFERPYFRKLLEKYIAPVPYTREALFHNMSIGRPSVLVGFPPPTREPLRQLSPIDAGTAIIQWLASRRSSEKHKVATDSRAGDGEFTIREIALKWQANKTRFGITDLHIRNTILESIINPECLSSFNILCNSSSNAQANEIFSVVISSSGHVTDSHSDDPNSSNFCFVGKKLWLAWDTYEGLTRGLEDVERIPLYKQAQFDMMTWLSLPSACWFVVNSNETLFLPANLTHKVITIERYVGVGGFFVAVPNCLRTLAHWITKGPLWSKRDSTGENDELIEDIARSSREKILGLRRAGNTERLQWGYDFLEHSAQAFIEGCPGRQLQSLCADPRFSCVAETINASWPDFKRGSTPLHL